MTPSTELTVDQSKNALSWFRATKRALISFELRAVPGCALLTGNPHGALDLIESTNTEKREAQAKGEKLTKRDAPKAKKPTPEDEFESRKHRDASGKLGIPAQAIIGLLRELCSDVKGVVPEHVLRTLRIEVDERGVIPFLDYDRCAMLRLPANTGRGMQTTYFPAFYDWRLGVTITFDETFIKGDQLMQMIDSAGWNVGL